MTRTLCWALGVLAVLGCDRAVGPSIEAPTNLTYQVEASGDPDAPRGVLLRWDGVSDANLSLYRVYSRASDGASYDLRASTTSTTFHDRGRPDLDYYVTALHKNGDESDPSNAVRVDEYTRLPAPASLSSVSLNGAVHLDWPDNAFESRPGGFRAYRVYSSSYSVSQNLCGATWTLEGSTISPQFLATSLSNGVTRCYGVSAESVEGFESLWSPLRADTPRPDARNVLMFPYQEDVTRAGFRFWQDLNANGQVNPGELGIVTSGDRTDIDFWIFRDAADTLFIVPEAQGTTVALYGTAPISDLTSIDYAPAGGYAASAISMVPGFGYVFRVVSGGTTRYGAIRLTHVSRDYVILDWSYQTDANNPELRVGGGVDLYQGGVTVVPR